MSTGFFYIVLDPERATGPVGDRGRTLRPVSNGINMEDLAGEYSIVCPYESALTKIFAKQGVRIFVLERDCREENFEDALRGGTYGMMKLACVREFIQAGSAVLVLKNSALIEQECAKNDWRLLAPPAGIAKKYEDKLTQFQAFKDVAPFPPTRIASMNVATHTAERIGFPCVLQFNAGHSGGGTAILQGPSDIAPFLERYPNREVRIAKYIEGATYTLNALAARNGMIYTGSISKQLTGLGEATNNPSTTVGNDWTAARDELNQKQAEEIAHIAQKIGEYMFKDGYRGLFGIDVIAERGARIMHFIEINTHQPASISFEAKIHRAIGKIPLMSLFLGDALEEDFAPTEDALPPLLFSGHAKQVIYRNKSDKPVPSSDINAPEGAMMSRMKMVKPNEELYRIQELAVEP